MRQEGEIISLSDRVKYWCFLVDPMSSKANGRERCDQVYLLLKAFNYECLPNSLTDPFTRIALLLLSAVYPWHLLLMFDRGVDRELCVAWRGKCGVL